MVNTKIRGGTNKLMEHSITKETTTIKVNTVIIISTIRGMEGIRKIIKITAWKTGTGTTSTETTIMTKLTTDKSKKKIE